MCKGSSTLTFPFSNSACNFVRESTFTSTSTLCENAERPLRAWHTVRSALVYEFFINRRFPVHEGLGQSEIQVDDT